VCLLYYNSFNSWICMPCLASWFKFEKIVQSKTLFKATVPIIFIQWSIESGLDRLDYCRDFIAKNLFRDIKDPDGCINKYILILCTVVLLKSAKSENPAENLPGPGFGRICQKWPDAGLAGAGGRNPIHDPYLRSQLTNCDGVCETLGTALNNLHVI